MSSFVSYLKSKINNLTEINNIDLQSLKIGVKCNNNPEIKSNDDLIACITSFEKCKISSLNELECNGLILDKDLNVIMLPAHKLWITGKRSGYYNKALVNEYLKKGDYDIFPALDGTMINVYSYNNEWRISTTNSYDCSNIKFNQQYTFKKILSEVLESYNSSFDEFTSSLEFGHSYSFIMTHPVLQALNNIMSLTLVHKADLKTFEKTADDHKVSQLYTIKAQKTLKSVIIDGLQNLANRSISNFWDTGNANYGYVLRAKPTSDLYKSNISHTNISIESSFKTFIKEAFYDHNFLKLCRQKSYDKEKALIVYNMLNSNKLKYTNNLLPLSSSLLHNTLFAKIFYKHKEDIELYKKFIQEVLKESSVYCRNVANTLRLHHNMISTQELTSDILNVSDFTIIYDHWTNQ